MVNPNRMGGNAIKLHQGQVSSLNNNLTMAAKFVLPAIAISIGLVQVLVPHVSRTYTLLGLRRDEAYFTSPDYTHALDPLCHLHHTDKFLGCEDMHLVELPSSTFIFTACLSSFANRPRVFTALRESHTPSPPGDQIFRWDLDTDSAIPLELRNFPDAPTASFHGMDVNKLPDGTLSIYIINHRPSSSTIEKFHHDPSTSHLTHLTTIPTNSTTGPKYPNDIYALPHLDSSHAFFTTSEARYGSGPLHRFEQLTRRSWSSVHYYSTSTSWQLALPSIAGANGISGDKRPNGRVYISAILNGEIIVADQDAGAPGVLKELQRVQLGFTGDNVAVTASGGDVFVAGYTRPNRVVDHVVDQRKVGPGAVVARVSTRQVGGGFFGEGYTGNPMVEEVFVDVGGRWVNASSTAVFRERVVGVEVEEVKEVEDEEGHEVVEEAKEEGKGTGVGDLYITGLTTSGILKCRDFK